MPRARARMLPSRGARSKARASSSPRRRDRSNTSGAAARALRLPNMWRKLGEWPIRDGYRAIVGRRYRLPSGLEHEFEIKLEGETVAVVAFTPAQEVVLVREFRPGPEAELLELPGGAIDAGEGPVEAARRELLEETGYEAVVEHVAVAFDCAYSTRRRHVCVGRDARRVAEPTP